MPTSLLIVLSAVVAGWLVQLYLTFKQSEAFNKQVVRLRRQGTVTVGVAGRRYRGGRAYVAMAISDRKVVVDAITLSGWTTFARGRTLTALVGTRTSQVKGTQVIPGLTHQQRDAAREAVVLLERERRQPSVQPGTG
jgi:DNA-binding transcriptional regulator of glucitol operon